MIHFDYHVAPSRIPGAGQGLFLAHAVARGRVIVAPTDIRTANLLPRRQLPSLSPEVAAASIRWFEDCCTVDPDWSAECYINHSFMPNGLWHLGFVFALEDLPAGTELTVDYRLLLDEGANPGFRDALTGIEITGLSWQQSLRRSTELLLGLSLPVRRATETET